MKAKSMYHLSLDIASKMDEIEAQRRRDARGMLSIHDMVSSVKFPIAGRDNMIEEYTVEATKPEEIRAMKDRAEKSKQCDKWLINDVFSKDRLLDSVRQAVNYYCEVGFNMRDDVTKRQLQEEAWAKLSEHFGFKIDWGRE